MSLQAAIDQVITRGTRFVIVTGGVCSSIGKGVLISSLGALLKHAGNKVSLMKCDPYLNVDPGTMSPSEHGEVFVTQDGAETDLDVGHYERVLGEPLSKHSSVSSGKVFSKLLSDERTGAYLGKTIMFVPHVVDEIQSRILSFATKSDLDYVMIEIGGTVGDMEGEIFLEAIRQLRQALPSGHLVHCHLSLVPYLSWANEVKTKPTQHSVMLLKRAGLTPDMLFLRTEKDISSEQARKVAAMCGVAPDNVFSVHTRTPQYELFFDLSAQGADIALQKIAGTPLQKANLTQWRELLDKIKSVSRSVRIALIAKYVGENEPYISLIEALKSAGYAHDVSVDIVSVSADSLEQLGKNDIGNLLSQFDGIVIPGGFGVRGVEGKILAAQWARKNNIPFFGICLGMQVMLIEAARSLANYSTATSIEFDAHAVDPVITLIDEQQNIVRKGGTMRLGSYACAIKNNTKAREAYMADTVSERHRHRYEFNNKYRQDLESQGVLFSGVNIEKNLVEIAEHADHPFMVGVQFHPEYQSTPLKPHALFASFIAAVKKIKKK